MVIIIKKWFASAECFVFLENLTAKKFEDIQKKTQIHTNFELTGIIKNYLL